MDKKILKEENKTIINFTDEIMKWCLVKEIPLRIVLEWIALLLKHPKVINKLGPNRIEINNNEIFFIIDGNVTIKTASTLSDSFINFTKETITSFYTNALIYKQILKFIK